MWRKNCLVNRAKLKTVLQKILHPPHLVRLQVNRQRANPPKRRSLSLKSCNMIAKTNTQKTSTDTRESQKKRTFSFDKGFIEISDVEDLDDVLERRRTRPITPPPANLSERKRGGKKSTSGCADEKAKQMTDINLHHMNALEMIGSSCQIATQIKTKSAAPKEQVHFLWTSTVALMDHFMMVVRRAKRGTWNLPDLNTTKKSRT